MSRWSASLWTRHHRLRVISNPNFPARPAAAVGGGWPGGGEEATFSQGCTLGYEPATRFAGSNPLIFSTLHWHH
ncbi:MAG: hypothetical protein HY774_09455 [Acidobacteria bacterium]|nr:hypothetical protein [Acidobacteriota bacterium]